MSKGGLILFIVVINFLTLDWEPKHITIGLFEVKGIIRIGFARPNYRVFFKCMFSQGKPYDIYER
jgi:hypothetical protein